MAVCMAQHPEGGPACVQPHLHQLTPHRDIDGRTWPLNVERRPDVNRPRYRLWYQAVENGDLVLWEKTLAELSVPNGMNENLLQYMLRECDERGLYFRLETVVPT